VQPAYERTLTLAVSTTGEGALYKGDTGTLRLDAALGNAGGVRIDAGTLAFTNDVFGAKTLHFNGGTARYTGAEALSLGAPLLVDADSVLGADAGALTLDGSLAFGASVTLAVEGTNGVTFSRDRRPLSQTACQLQLLEGSCDWPAGCGLRAFQRRTRHH
jgi:hypothetical protein